MKKYQRYMWTEEMQSGTINIGFTREYIDLMLNECFHITQAQMYLVTEGKPMLTIETNEGLKVLLAPCTGVVASFSSKARDFPDKLTEEDVVLVILPKKEVKAAKAKTFQQTTPDFQNLGQIDNWMRQGQPRNLWNIEIPDLNNNNNNNQG